MLKLSFTQKLWLPLVISLIALLIVSISAAYLSRETRIEERKNDLVNVAHAGLSITQQNAALVQQAAAAAQSLEEQARQLQHAMAVFHIGEAESGNDKRALARSEL